MSLIPRDWFETQAGKALPKSDRQAKKGFRPSLEWLEDRATPSTLLVGNEPVLVPSTSEERDDGWDVNYSDNGYDTGQDWR